MKKDRRILFFKKLKGARFDPFPHFGTELFVGQHINKGEKGNITRDGKQSRRKMTIASTISSANKERNFFFVFLSSLFTRDYHRKRLRVVNPTFYAVDDVIQTFDQSQIKPHTGKIRQQMVFFLSLQITLTRTRGGCVSVYSPFGLFFLASLTRRHPACELSRVWVRTGIQKYRKHTKYFISHTGCWLPSLVYEICPRGQRFLKTSRQS